MMREPANATLASTLWPSRAPLRLVRAAMLAIGGTLLLAASAKAQVPFYPVPMTLQTLAVLAIGAAYGARLAGATLLLYLGEGLAGLPVFAGVGAGPGYVAGPTGGFLVGFLVAAALVGWLAERGWGRSAPRLVGAMLLGQIALYALGAAWLASFIGLDKAWRFGVLPFLLADAVKTLLAAALIGAAARALARAPSGEA
jgi:biotin transport system substrate-specific component